ncbi:hypothetical protein [Actinacidiphila oryziradicis]|uniref:DUF2786 domain-containing protein n=1 Tax=Actinacidiphila oryziradicis TaxID=2571141 RepID=A0A4U0SK29_9ACTN|nr:hypothetical protein [Actinacidiphila oryziradicis]TKA09513.1 hypothetical protein FCI23_21960 [Actinacidiphila oryziradicis]
MEQRSRMAAKVDALRERGLHPETPVPEAELCMERAREIMEKYSLAEDEITSPKDGGSGSECAIALVIDNIGGRGRQWLLFYEEIAAAVGAYLVYERHKASDRKIFVELWGDPREIEILKVLIPDLYLQAESAMDVAAGWFRDRYLDGCGASRRNQRMREFRRSYIVGYGRGAAKKIRASLIVPETRHAPVKADDESGEEWIEYLEGIAPGYIQQPPMDRPSYGKGKRDGVKASISLNQLRS